MDLVEKVKNFQIDIGDLMRVVTWNVNGIRAAIRKGMDDWMAKIDADVWLLQEVRALPEQLPKDWELPSGMKSFGILQKKGYSVCLLFSCWDGRNNKRNRY